MSVSKFIKDMNKDNSTTSKRRVLTQYKDNEDVKKLLVYTYDPLKHYHVTSSNVKKITSTDQELKYNDMYDLLDALNSKEISGNAATEQVYLFSKKNPIILNIIDKNLKLRVNSSTINKSIPGLIPSFEPVLSKEYSSSTTLDSKWFISRKLDGVRCLVFIQKETSNVRAIAMSRNGKPLYNVDHILEDVFDKIKLPFNTVLDGELVSVDENGLENFKDTISIVRSSKNKKDNSSLVYKAFDMIPEREFIDCEGPSTFADRYEFLKEMTKNCESCIQVVEQIPWSSIQMSMLSERVKENNWEGLMVRKNTTYKGKRTSDLLKIKKFMDKEFTVLKTINGNMRVIDDKTGLEKNIKCLSAVVIKNNKVEVKVGSGFSLDQRKTFYGSPDKIVGKNITVKYFEETPDGSLRFPIFIEIRDYE